ncbi:MAG TPA: hypothetical protein VFI00_19080 [Kribbella sp.]|nr:hypothetical protein [Kribbella sp.]
MPAEDLQELKDQVDALRGQLEEITEQDWLAYEKVRDILRVARTIVEVPTVPQTVAAREGEAEAFAATAAGVPSYYITHPTSHACAMLGIFEPAQGEGTSTEYDAAAVERFATLGR